MTLDKIAQAYTDWVAYETNPSPQLKDQLARFNERPTAEADRFFADLVKKYSEATDVFWIQQAIAYAQSATDKAVAQQYLEQLLSDYSRYGVLGPVLNTACSRLGRSPSTQIRYSPRRSRPNIQSPIRGKISSFLAFGRQLTAGTS